MPQLQRLHQPPRFEGYTHPGLEAVELLGRLLDRLLGRFVPITVGYTESGVPVGGGNFGEGSGCGHNPSYKMLKLDDFKSGLKTFRMFFFD
ncbi:hypothetical protein AB2M95_15215 [Pseudomonas chlororaphis]|uniref:hypothetical protein n=1 Tax=Pseudomonas chlororaphis TaxID=587753 RepID=UPI00346377A4